MSHPCGCPASAALPLATSIGECTDGNTLNISVPQTQMLPCTSLQQLFQHLHCCESDGNFFHHILHQRRNIKCRIDNQAGC